VLVPPVVEVPAPAPPVVLPAELGALVAAPPLAADEDPEEAPDAVVEVVEVVEVEVVPVVWVARAGVAAPVVGIVSAGAPEVSVVPEPPLPQAARPRQRASAATVAAGRDGDRAPARASRVAIERA
jgi:hypothetical protein